MFRPFRRLLVTIADLITAIQTLSVQLRALSEVQQKIGPAVDRLDVLEREKHQFEAMCEGLLLKAEGKLRSANNAEARTRADKKSYEHLIDPFPEDVGGETPDGDAVHSDDAPRGEAERLHAMRLDVAPPNSKTLAQRAKFGVR